MRIECFVTLYDICLLMLLKCISIYDFLTKSKGIGHNNANIEWSSYKNSDWRSLTFELYYFLGCASGCVVECQICNREVAGLNLSLGYFAPRSTQPFIPPGSVNEYQLRVGRQRQVWLIPIAGERVDVQVKLWNPLRTRAIPERFCGGDSLRRGAISSICMYAPWTF